MIRKIYVLIKNIKKIGIVIFSYEMRSDIGKNPFNDSLETSTIA